MLQVIERCVSILAALLLSAGIAAAQSYLDGRSFSGTIGPKENPDLADTLFFADGYFWSDICTRCGFVPAPYTSNTTDDGIAFSGVLQSEGRGQFDYTGLVSPDGAISVDIYWHKKRWYWRSERTLVFLGNQNPNQNDAGPTQVIHQMLGMDPKENPLCARF